LKAAGRTSSKASADQAKAKKGKELEKPSRGGQQPNVIPKRMLGRVSMSQLRNLYQHAFNEKQMPDSRASIISELDDYLQKLPEDERATILISLSRTIADSTDTFRRWAQIISKPGRNSRI
jgi:hypothetical protein